MRLRLHEDSKAGKQPLGWIKAIATAFAITFALYAVAAIWTIYSERTPVDFVSFWAAGKLALSGHPALAYDIDAHLAVELREVWFDGYLPFPYPPPFLLIIAPFALAAFPLAFALWVALTGLLYVGSARKIAPLPYALAQPQVFSNAAIGQNGFLTSAIFIAGTSLLKRNSFAGGAVLGLLVIKPQLAILIPVALLAARHWQAIGGSLVSEVGVNILALIVFGVAPFRGFLEILPVYSQWVASDRWPWQEIATPFAFLRYFGVAPAIAWGVHAVIAFIAAIAVWDHWSRNSDRRVHVLAAATILVPPYLLTYDALILVLPLAWLVETRRSPILIGLAWLLCAIPVGIHFGNFTAPNTVPIAALLMLVAIHWPLLFNVQLQLSPAASGKSAV